MQRDRLTFLPFMASEWTWRVIFFFMRQEDKRLFRDTLAEERTVLALRIRAKEIL